MKKKRSAVQGNVEDLWGTATFGVVLEQVPEVDGEVKMAPSRWREVVVEFMQSALEYNEEGVRAIRLSQQKTAASTITQGEVFVTSKLLTSQLEVGKEELQPREESFAEIIASLEREALELSKVGQEVAIGLGLLPPPPPSFIQSFVDGKELEIIAQQILERDLINEQLTLEGMYREEISMRKFIEHERFREAHKKRVLAIRHQCVEWEGH